MTTPQDAPKRFTPDQVLAVVQAAGADSPPLSTNEVAGRVREAHGMKAWRTDVPGNADVVKALAALVERGDLVTSKRPGYRRKWDGDDERYAFLIPPANNTERFYATPAAADAWEARLATAARENAHADMLVAEIGQAIEMGGGGPPGGRVHPLYASSPTIGLHLTIEQAEYVLARLDPETGR